MTTKLITRNVNSTTTTHRVTLPSKCAVSVDVTECDAFIVMEFFASKAAESGDEPEYKAWVAPILEKYEKDERPCYSIGANGEFAVFVGQP